MRKALALILGIILMFGSIPSISAFADSDPGFSNLVLNHSFSWYSDFPYVDTYGWIYNSYFQSATLVSNGVTSYPSPSTVPTLYQAGDYFEVSFDSDLLSTYQTPLWNVMIAYDSSTATTHFDIPLDSINCYLCDELAFYDFQTELSADGRRWRCISFISPSNYLSNTTIRIEYNGNGGPITIPITMICLRGYRFTPSGSLTEQEMVELQSNIVNALNTARLADMIGNLDTSDVDLTTLESTTASILQKLANVPDIIQYIDQIETNQSSILSAINTFYNYYFNSFQTSYAAINNLTLYDDSFNSISGGYTINHDGFIYLYIPYPRYSGDLVIFKILTSGYPVQSVSYNFTTNTTNYSFTYDNNAIYYSENSHVSGRYYNYIYIPNIDLNWNTSSTYYIRIKLDFKKYTSTFTNSVWTYSVYYSGTSNTWYKQVLIYLRSLLGNDSQVPSSIETVNNTVADQIDDITQFEDNYNQSLDTSASQIDVSTYQINQTSGMSWMRTYTEYNFDQMQNFRILFLTPLVLALAAFFLRRKQ